MKIIETLDDIAEGAAWLAAQDERIAQALTMTGPLPLRRRKDGFETLFLAIVGQQISIAAADAMRRRLKAARLTGPRKIAAAGDDALRACGLSRQTIVYAKALAGAGIRYAELRECSTEEVVETLVVVPGIGRWTAEIYAMFALGHADAFASGDLALQEGARILLDLEKRPTDKGLRVISETWSPWRGVAARLLWSFYSIKKRE
jgi:DNA-3-methyladenine glycosylase II